MENNFVLEETRKILELMTESEEKVSLLQEDFTENQTVCEQLKENLKYLRDGHNKNLADSEDNENLKKNIKACNQEFLNCAQKIYSDNQELYSDLPLHHSELIQNEELLKGNTEIFENNIKEFEMETMLLTEELELINNAEIENKKQRELDSKAMVEDNEQLGAELKVLDEKIGAHEECIRRELPSLDEYDYEKLIENLGGSVHSKENEISYVSIVLEEIKQFKEKLEFDSKVNISELDSQIKESEIAINESRMTIGNLQQNIDEVCNQIELLKESAKQRENENVENEEELHNIELTLKQLEESCNTKKLDHEKLVLEKEETYKLQTDLKMKIKLDISTAQNKIDSKQEEIVKISNSLSENKTDTDLKAKLDEKEEAQKDLKITYQEVKQRYDNEIIELEAQLKRGQEEIQMQEEANKELQQNTDSLVVELNRWKTELQKLGTQKKNQFREMSVLDEKIKKLNLQIAQKKAKSAKKGNDVVTAAGETSGPVKGKRSRLRHWDSDSTIEEEDRRLSDMIKEKMKAKKLIKGSRK